jgi:hypothetical protein
MQIARLPFSHTQSELDIDVTVTVESLTGGRYVLGGITIAKFVLESRLLFSP